MAPCSPTRGTSMRWPPTSIVRSGWTPASGARAIGGWPPPSRGPPRSPGRRTSCLPCLLRSGTIVATMPDLEHWLSVARATSLGILTDLDGTLVPIAATADAARPKPDVRKLLRELAAQPGLLVAVVSGRPRETLDKQFADCAGLLLVAEHGGWRRDSSGWQPAFDAGTDEVESLTRMLGGIA